MLANYLIMKDANSTLQVQMYVSENGISKKSKR